MKRIFHCLFVLAVLISCSKSDGDVVIYQSSLTTSQSTWYTGSGTGYSIGFNQSSYQISVTQSDYWAYAIAPTPSTLSYAYSITVDAVIQLTDNTKDGYVGIVYNFIDINNCDVLQISPDGQYEIFNVVGGVYSYPVAWTTNNAINQGSGATNRIELIQNLSSMQIFVNGKSISQFSYPIVPNSSVGIMAHSSYESANFTNITGSFNNIVIKKLK